MDKAKLTHIPDSPGVYIFKEKTGNILYIGKARSLKKRVGSYFTRPQSLKIQIMMSKVACVDYIVTKSETEARLKEANFIKENLPPYNTVFRDDKSFPLICISKENSPVIWVARRTNKRLKKLAIRFFGPYTNATLLREALKSIRQIFGYRSCFKMPRRPCLYYRLNLCPAPCAGKISVRKYQDIIRNITLFLEGRYEDLVNRLTVKMHNLANDKKFEEAAEIRNQIQTLLNIASNKHPGGYRFEQGISFISDSYPECSNFLRITSGYRKGTLERCDIRYRESVELKEDLELEIRPQRIEAFDVSNISGSSACASMVSFYEGKPDKSNYRRFRIKSVFGIDDCKMLEEAVTRRYRRLIEERLNLPDLIIIDGGRAQLNAVKRKLKELDLEIPVISIAKQKEEIYALNQEVPIKLKPDSLALHLIQRIRNEAHRFALAYHHVLRRKKTLGK